MWEIVMTTSFVVCFVKDCMVNTFYQFLFTIGFDLNPFSLCQVFLMMLI